MKKFLLFILLCLTLILPSFSAEKVSTTQLNKQGWEYIKKQDYQKAYIQYHLF